MKKIAAWLIGALAASLAAAPSVVIADSSPGCSSGDPYGMTAAQRAGCGVVAYPKTSATRQADGWTKHVYGSPDHETWAMTPPPGFDPRTAPPGELAEYGIPPEPPASDPGGRQRWEAAAARMTWIEPPDHLMSLPSLRMAPPSTSGNWAGYLDYESSSYFHYTFMQFIQPAQLSSRCSSNSAAIWTGLGGVDSTAFGQNGTAMGQVMGEYQAWFETDAGPVYALNMYGTPGSNFLVQTSYANGAYRYNFYNSHTGQNAVFFVNDSRFYGDAADYVVERPMISGSFTNLSNFGTLTVDDALVTSGNVPISDYPTDRVTMVNSNDGVTLASPSALTNGDYFTVTQRSCN